MTGCSICLKMIVAPLYNHPTFDGRPKTGKGDKRPGARRLSVQREGSQETREEAASLQNKIAHHDMQLRERMLPPTPPLPLWRDSCLSPGCNVTSE